jgi:hypothetical protein
MTDERGVLGGWAESGFIWNDDDGSNGESYKEFWLEAWSPEGNEMADMRTGRTGAFANQAQTTFSPDGFCTQVSSSLRSSISPPDVRFRSPQGIHQAAALVYPALWHMAGPGPGQGMDEGNWREGQGADAADSANRIVCAFSMLGTAVQMMIIQ